MGHFGMLCDTCRALISTHRPCGDAACIQDVESNELMVDLPYAFIWASNLWQDISLEPLYRTSQCTTLFRIGTQTMDNHTPTKWPCHVCRLNLGFRTSQVRDRLTPPERSYIRLHHPSVQFICYDCLQNVLDERHKRWWQEVFHNHVVLADPMIQNRVSQYLWSSIHQHPCLCGDCDPSWRLREWICRG